MIFLNYLVLNIKVYKITQTRIFISVILFLDEKDGYKMALWKRKFGFSMGLRKVCQVGLFIAT